MRDVDLQFLEGTHRRPDLGGQPAALPARGTPCAQAMGVEDPADRRGRALDTATRQQGPEHVLTQARISAAQADHLVLDGRFR
ncbi:MAG: hypothetical protein QN210_04530 [Armatimonadota bacterium]|nr:hypothetical protein [Armatimonadota bacterium]